MNDSKKNQTIQLRIGQKTPESTKEWVNNQSNPNDAAKRVLEHFIRIYGVGDIDSDEIQVKMAKDLLMAKGGLDLSPTNSVNTISNIKQQQNSNISEEKKDTSFEINAKSEPQQRQVVRRGEINV
ncbi:hypothetical protein [Heyndrickxia oleronia]|uniref:Uncharacterized protein n=1 Tax=Heyndrickxia oleronia TaxID=38875 RepID=A0AAW6SYW0_9BACI|nr:hypothetical protein [Heyndrickxia oleronia]MDH5163423.1 hypothetical protein [Heyndrickxia oleronia]